VEEAVEGPTAAKDGFSDEDPGRRRASGISGGRRQEGVTGGR